LLSDVPDWLVALSEKWVFLSLAVRRRGTRPRLAPSGRRKDALGRWTTWRSSSVSSARAGSWGHSRVVAEVERIGGGSSSPWACSANEPPP